MLDELLDRWRNSSNQFRFLIITAAISYLSFGFGQGNFSFFAWFKGFLGYWSVLHSAVVDSGIFLVVSWWIFILPIIFTFWHYTLFSTALLLYVIDVIFGRRSFGFGRGKYKKSIFSKKQKMVSIILVIIFLIWGIFGGLITSKVDSCTFGFGDYLCWRWDFSDNGNIFEAYNERIANRTQFEINNCQRQGGVVMYFLEDGRAHCGTSDNMTEWLKKYPHLNEEEIKEIRDCFGGGGFYVRKNLHCLYPEDGAKD